MDPEALKSFLQPGVIESTIGSFVTTLSILHRRDFAVLPPGLIGKESVIELPLNQEIEIPGGLQGVAIETARDIGTFYLAAYGPQIILKAIELAQQTDDPVKLAVLTAIGLLEGTFLAKTLLIHPASRIKHAIDFTKENKDEFGIAASIIGGLGLIRLPKHLHKLSSHIDGAMTGDQIEAEIAIAGQRADARNRSNELASARAGMVEAVLKANNQFYLYLAPGRPPRQPDIDRYQLAGDLRDSVEGIIKEFNLSQAEIKKLFDEMRQENVFLNSELAEIYRTL